MVSVRLNIIKCWKYGRFAIYFYLVWFLYTLTPATSKKHKHEESIYSSGGSDLFRLARPLMKHSNHSNERYGRLNTSLGVLKYSNISAIDGEKKIKETEKILHNSKAVCQGNFAVYDNGMVKLSNVVLDPKLGKGRSGGEDMRDVWNQREEVEYFELEPGYFKLKCSEEFNVSFHKKSHFNTWMKVLKPTEILPESAEEISTWTIAVLRIEYAHLYFTTLDLYNAYLVIHRFGLNPDQTNILLMDGHPAGGLDSTWDVLFGNVTRVGHIKEPVCYSNLVWNEPGHDSELNQLRISSRTPDTENFRRFVLSRYGIHTERVLDCNKLKILFLWRRDYLAHPRNPSGIVARKIKNEDELIHRTKELFPGHVIEGLQMDRLVFKDQLEVIANTDILIGMHGAGLTHAIYLPKHAALIELFPMHAVPSHFEWICRWRKLQYAKWQNTYPDRELAGHYTVVDVEAVMTSVMSKYNRMCPNVV